MGKEYKHAFDRDGIVYVKGTINGKRYRLSTSLKSTAHNLKRVDRDWREEIERIQNGEELKKVGEIEGVNFGEFGLKSLIANSGGRKENTNIDYLRDFKNIISPELGDMSIESITPMDLKQWQTKMSQKGMGGNRIRNLRNIIRGVLNDAVDEGIISENPIKKIKPIAIDSAPIKPFGLEEIKIILGEAEGFFKNMLTVAFFSGLRSGELLALKWSDVNFQSKEIHINTSTRKGKETSPKTKTSTRVVDMLKVVEDALKNQYLDTGLRSEYVFVSSRNKPFLWVESLTKRHWHPLLRRCALDQRDFYHTRHTFATLMLKQKEELMWVSKMLGHKDSSITLQRYAKFVEDKKIKRAEFLDILTLENQDNEETNNVA